MRVKNAQLTCFMLTVIVFAMALHPAHAQQMQMLPPTPYGTGGLPGTTAGCSAYQALIYSGATGLDAKGKPISAINCVPLTIGSNGKMVTTGISINNTWGSNDQVNINGNQIWNNNGWLYLNYSDINDGWVMVGGGSTWQGLYVARGDLNVANGNLTVNGNVTVNGNLNVNGQFCLNGKCISSLGAMTTSFYIPATSRTDYRNPFTGTYSCPAGTTDGGLVTLWYGYAGDGSWVPVHICSPS